MKYKSLTTFAIFGCSLALSFPAASQTYADAMYGQQAQSYGSEASGDWDVSIGAGALVKPEYEGADDYEILPIPYIDVNYKNRVTLNPFDGLRYNVLEGSGVAMGVGLDYDYGRDEDDDSRLEGLGDVDGTLEGQLFASYSEGRVSAEVVYAHDIVDGHEGYTIEAETGYAVPLPHYKMLLRPSISTTYASEDYMSSYFGVSGSQSAASGLPAYDADAGFKDVSAQMLASYQIDENWSMNGLLQYKQLLGDAADSPIVEDEGQVLGGAFIAYKFN